MARYIDADALIDATKVLCDRYITQICKWKFNQAFGYSWCYVEELI